MDILNKFRTGLKKTSSYLASNIIHSLKSKQISSEIINDVETSLISADIGLEVTELLVDKIGPIGKKIKDLLKDEKYLDQILENGAQKADNLASKKINKIKDLIGF